MYYIDNKMVFPTLEFIKQETGFDLLYETDDMLKAQGTVKSITKLAYRVLMSEKILETQTRLKELILEDERYRREFLEFVLSIIEDVYTSGTFDFMNVETDKILSPKSKLFLEQGLLAVGVFRRHHKW